MKLCKISTLQQINVDMLLGDKIRTLRTEYEVKQRQLAIYLHIDTPLLCKIERGERRAKREHVILLARFFHIDEKEMLSIWLADKVLNVIVAEDKDGIREAALQIKKKAINS